LKVIGSEDNRIEVFRFLSSQYFFIESAIDPFPESPRSFPGVDDRKKLIRAEFIIAFKTEMAYFISLHR
jgi:hypothetical protein